jgi:hypothetical protein
MRMGRRAALVAVLMSLLTLGLGSAVAAAPTRPATTRPATTRPATTRPGAGLFSVSCPTMSFCLAVGSHSGPAGRRHTLAEEWNGKSWRVLANPPGVALGSVSCTSVTFCGALGGPLGSAEFLTWNGHVWRSHRWPQATTSGISCYDRFYCVVIREYGEIEAWNGVRWHGAAGTRPCSAGPANGCALLDVSCASATECMAIGSAVTASNATESWAALYDGHQWTASVPPDTPLDSVACSRQGLCMTTGTSAGGYIADSYTTATGWTKDSPGPSCGSHCDIAVPTISCTGLTNCMVINSSSWTSYSWNGAEWETVKLAAAPRPPGYLDSVSCAAATDCILVGGYNREGLTSAFSERWNGTTWHSVKTPSPS